MALTLSSVNQNNSTSSGTTLTIGSITAAVGDWLIVIVACDNSATGGGTPLDDNAVTDSAGNSYTRRTNRTQQTGTGPGEGVSMSAYTAEITSALSSGTVTVTLSTNTTSKAALVRKVVPGAGEAVSWVTNGGAQGSTNTPTITSSSITNGDVVIGYVGIETNQSTSQDSDTTNGTWSTQHTAVANTTVDGTSIRVSSQHKTVTATATQTYNVSITNARDWVIHWAHLRAVQVGSGMLLSSARNRLIV